MCILALCARRLSASTPSGDFVKHNTNAGYVDEKDQKDFSLPQVMIRESLVELLR